MADAFFSTAGRDGSDKIVRRKLSDQVLERMRELILSGGIGPGETLPSEHALTARAR